MQYRKAIFSGDYRESGVTESSGGSVLRYTST